MHEYERLERRWRRYRLKRLFLYALLPTALFIVGVWYFWQKNGVFSATLHKQSMTLHATNYLSPSLAFEKRLQNRINRKTAKEFKKREVAKKETKEQKSPKTPVTIVSQSITLPDMLRSFEKNPSASLALLIAKKYFAKENYKKALEWSIKANELDKRNEESWILYARSASRLGDKKRAMQALLIIIKKSDSQESKRLLRMLAKGQRI